jgi:predicted nucleic acid-binding protein
LIVVSETSPILNLAAVDKLRLLHDLYTEIVVPPAVAGFWIGDDLRARYPRSLNER